MKYLIAVPDGAADETLLGAERPLKQQICPV